MNFSELSKTRPFVKGDQEKITKTNKLLYKSLINELSKYSLSLKTKLDNVNKAGVDKCIPCTTKRVSQSSRICIKYKLIKKNNLNLSALNTYFKAVCILLNWKEYEELKYNQNRDELDDYLFNNIGSDNTVSCIICIMKSDGYSGSNNEREDKLKLDEEAIKLNWFPIRRKENIKQLKNINEGNDKWEGHYHYEISGGKHESLKSWEGEDQPQIFTTHKGFMATQNVIDAVYISLIYMLIHVHDIGKALDHEIEGSHVDIGIRILQKFGADPRVITAMKSHHDEYPYESIEAIIVQSADASRQSIISVSMDEEMGKMMKYKFAYNASAKVIGIMDQMLDTIINRMLR
jgi:hypothetical protein